ncbi:hypothetical protein BDP55DRAFT_684125 [Colletotrichum godetiae]|uniref:Uncharacterized protein n=1 Tax=Colletotrichum godetiae TaxID=1209918 RepID=A0AAJ0EMW1_9PEZI|nr:uncharacterized protein BDP55DRAFT_684125 [Colletotrichum godetiae]KAK1657916.1 hypothetical protein BDP55DRAFT_684125 [Colletotrichum godetiae]
MERLFKVVVLFSLLAAFGLVLISYDENGQGKAKEMGAWGHEKKWRILFPFSMRTCIFLSPSISGVGFSHAASYQCQ